MAREARAGYNLALRLLFFIPSYRKGVFYAMETVHLREMRCPECRCSFELRGWIFGDVPSLLPQHRVMTLECTFCNRVLDTLLLPLASLALFREQEHKGLCRSCDDIFVPIVERLRHGISYLYRDRSLFAVRCGQCGHVVSVHDVLNSETTL